MGQAILHANTLQLLLRETQAARGETYRGFQRKKTHRIRIRDVAMPLCRFSGLRVFVSTSMPTPGGERPTGDSHHPPYRLFVASASPLLLKTLFPNVRAACKDDVTVSTLS